MYPRNFEILFSDASWRTTWTHIVPGRFSLSPYTCLLFFEQSTGYAEVYETDGQGHIIAPALQTYNPLGGRPQWTHIIPGYFGPSGLTGILLYDQASGFARFFDCNGAGLFVQLSEYSDWRTTWTQIVPGLFTRRNTSGLVFYSPSENYGELWETDGVGLAGTAPTQTFTDWRSTWTHIVAADFYWTPGYNSAPAFTDIFFYEGSTGYGEMYYCGKDEQSSGGLVPYPVATGQLIQDATNVVAGNFGTGFSGLLLHDRSAGQLKIYYFDGNGGIRPVETLSGLRRTFDLIVPGNFFMANPDDHWFNDGPSNTDFPDEARNWRVATGGFTDLLLYDRAAGLGETYLHEPLPPPDVTLEAYITYGISGVANPLVPGIASLGNTILVGDTISFHVSSLERYTIKIYREGYFAGGQTEQFMTQVGGVFPATGSLPISRTAYRDGADWPPVATVSISDYPTGLYLARFEDAASPPNVVDVAFVVRAPAVSETRILLVIADMTYNAYNTWGGRDVYGFESSTDDTRTAPNFVPTYPSCNQVRAPYAFELSFQRPLGYSLGNMPQSLEIPAIQWLMRQGVPVDVCTDRDLHFAAPSFPNYRLLLFVGHHEYWTWEMRDNVENFVKAGGNAAFLCANTSWWQVRVSPDGQMLTCFKIAGFDPAYYSTTPQLTTINWFSPPVKRPETEMTGASYYGCGINLPPIPFVVENAAHWSLAGTGLQTGDPFGLFGPNNANSIIEYSECDVAQPVGGSPMASPPGYTIASAFNPGDNPPSLTGSMGSFIPGEGAGEVFNGATINWALALADDQGQNNHIPRITQNVIDRLGPGFRLVLGFAHDIGAGADGSVWTIGSDAQPTGYGIYHWNGAGWDQVAGAGVRIAVDPNGNPWVVNGVNQIFRFVNGAWQGVPGLAQDIGIGADGSVWVIGAPAGVAVGRRMWDSGIGVDGSFWAAQQPDPGGYGIYKWTGSEWQQVGGAGVRIAVDPRGNAWVVNRAGGIFQFDGGSWKQYPGAGIDIGVGPDGSVWVVGTEALPTGPAWESWLPQGNGVFRWNGVDAWRQVRGGAVSVSVGPGGDAWVVDKALKIFRWE
ncbi:MAG TPA: N,N-dimethylformamidase beta subunit family domain-containing protein [Xanthobacteraceae bacterium]|nr:N,N-dimethylformamidase beta subunit family domain-containing protein [Xanthobacteraceae bacterium]